MGRERAGKPGVTWQQQPTRVELVVDEATGKPVGLSRADRRRLERAAKRKGGRR